MPSISDFRAACARIGDALRPLGLVAGRNGRTWSGDHDGRRWSLSLTPQRRTQHRGELQIRTTQGYRLRIDASTGVACRVYFVLGGFATNALVRAIHRWRKLESLPVDIEGCDSFRAVTSDPDWARALVAQPRAAASLLELIEQRQQFGAGSSVYFEPGLLCYSSPLLNAAAVDERSTIGPLDALIFLAREAERLPPPTRPARLNRLERASRANPTLVAVLIVVGILGVFSFLGLLFFALLLGVATGVFG